MKTNHQWGYLTPEIEVVEVAIEMGFEGSSNVEDPMEDPTQRWF
jgi:hypothetical protein